jgi:arylsulfatase A-like enzyme
LADAMLGDVRRAMEGAGQWDSAAVVLISDHVMRYRPKYLREPDDRRVPFVVKLPGATTGLTYDRPFSALLAHDLVQALLRGELRTNADLVAWLDAH